ncbi:uncharacterized protein LOC134836906 [Culicoides brevitarsis]|uniref:uncharacterized protein LOC134836906 n=1 Tax=Culicoides brevitarsis TaxID=469753 RepID=UPI00307BEB62
MCGIFGIICENSDKVNYDNFLETDESMREIAYRRSGAQRHRGPDHTGIFIYKENGVALLQERLAVMGGKKGDQPFFSDDGEIILVANGEIYNYHAVAAQLAITRKEYTPRNDCDVILGLYEEYGMDLLKYLSGMFAFVIYDRKKNFVMIARDPIGIIPFYQGRDKDGNLWVASEMKCLVEFCRDVAIFPPGHVMFGSPGKMTVDRYWKPTWEKEVPTTNVDLNLLRSKLESAVRTHLDCDAPFAALLSGGVDSSLVASIATKLMREKDPNFRLKTFSVGLKGAPDFKYSKIVADFIGSDHEEVYFTVEEGLDCIRELIYKLETYDITTVRCGILMYILIRVIKGEGYKMVLSGEGADEIFGGYLYFHSAPSAEEFHHETVARVKNLHLSDCLRANKCCMGWGVEPRVPFLDTEFFEHAMTIKPEDRMPIAGTKQSIEKYILRAAFADGYLPDSVLWRQKEQFSDGVGYNWIDSIKDYAASRITDEEFANAEEKFPFNTPATKEAYYYRKIFTQMFPHKSCAETVMKWVPRLDWGCAADPSGRAQKLHCSNES